MKKTTNIDNVMNKQTVTTINGIKYLVLFELVNPIKNKIQKLIRSKGLRNCSVFFFRVHSSSKHVYLILL